MHCVGVRPGLTGLFFAVLLTALSLPGCKNQQDGDSPAQVEKAEKPEKPEKPEKKKRQKSAAPRTHILLEVSGGNLGAPFKIDSDTDGVGASVDKGKRFGISGVGRSIGADGGIGLTSSSPDYTLDKVMIMPSAAGEGQHEYKGSFFNFDFNRNLDGGKAGYGLELALEKGSTYTISYDSPKTGTITFEGDASARGTELPPFHIKGKIQVR